MIQGPEARIQTGFSIRCDIYITLRFLDTKHHFSSHKAGNISEVTILWSHWSIYWVIYIPTLTYSHELQLLTQGIRSWLEEDELSLRRRVSAIMGSAQTGVSFWPFSVLLDKWRNDRKTRTDSKGLRVGLGTAVLSTMTCGRPLNAPS